MINIFLFACLFHDQVPGAPQTQAIVIKGGDLYTVSHGVLHATDLRLEGGKITAIGEVSLTDAIIVDAQGQRVYPGLIAPMTRLGLTEIDAVRATNDTAEVGDLTPEVLAGIAFNPDSELIPTVRSNGIAVAQVAPGGGLLQGQSSLLMLDGWNREDMALNMSVGMHLKWPNVRVREGWWVRDSAEEQRDKMSKQALALREAFAQAKAYHLAREASRIMPKNTRWESMRPLFKGEIPLYVEADEYKQIQQALEFTESFGLKMVLCGGNDAWRLADVLKERGIPVILAPQTRLPDRADDHYDLPYKTPHLLHESGVQFCISIPSSWAVRNLPLQAGIAMAFGLPDDAALRSITLSTAEILGVSDRLGSLDVGKDATIIISKGDITDTLGLNITAMYIQGRAVDLDNRHRQLHRKYATRLERAGK